VHSRLEKSSPNNKILIYSSAKWRGQRPEARSAGEILAWSGGCPGCQPKRKRKIVLSLPRRVLRSAGVSRHEGGRGNRTEPGVSTPGLVRGAVIHKLTPLRWGGPLRSLMYNCETDISGAIRSLQRVSAYQLDRITPVWCHFSSFVHPDYGGQVGAETALRERPITFHFSPGP
jgi:hypothetical protein